MTEQNETTTLSVLDKVDMLRENHRRIEVELHTKHQAKMTAMRERMVALEAERDAAALPRAPTRATAAAAASQIDTPIPASATSSGKAVLFEMDTANYEDALEAAAIAAEDAAIDAQGVLAKDAQQSVETQKNLDDALDANEQSLHIVEQSKIGVEKAAEPLKALERARSKIPEGPHVVRKKLVFNLNDVDRSVESHPSVAKAMAYAKEDERFGNEIFCAIIPKRGARASDAWLKLHAQTMLPAMMVPKKFYIVESLPLTRKELGAAQDIHKEFGLGMKPRPQHPVVHEPTWKFVPQV